MTSIVRKVGRRVKRLVTPPAPPPAPAGAEYYPDWPKLLGQDWRQWQSAIKRARGGPRILIPTSVGGHIPGAVFESLLAVALTLRGAEVHILLCDQHLPACLYLILDNTPDPAAFARNGIEPNMCRQCFRPADYMFRNLGLPVHYFSQLITADEAEAARQTAAAIPLKEVGAYMHAGVRVGEHATAGALRYFARGDFEGEPLAEPILRRYLRAALLSLYATQRCLRQLTIEAAVFNHGIYVPQGIIGEVARQAGVRVVNWNVAWRKGCFIASHGDTYHHTLMTEPVGDWEGMVWTPQHEAQVLAYLRSRWQGTQDWIWFHDAPQEDEAAILREAGLDRSRPIIGALTNVIWDAQLLYPANAFPNMQTWLFETIRYFERRPDLQLVIRVHPAEIRGTVPSRQRVVDEIQRQFPVLPGNVHVIPPDSQISTYALMAFCNAAIIYGTKMGVELSSQGLPIIAAGEAWIRNKGLTHDAHSVQEYFALLDQLPFAGPLDPTTMQRARKYAFHYFFRRMIPVTTIKPAPGPAAYQVQINRLDDLRPGRDRGLDILCQGILSGSRFTYPADTELAPN
jgi:hypothetical protein